MRSGSTTPHTRNGLATAQWSARAGACGLGLWLWGCALMSGCALVGYDPFADEWSLVDEPGPGPGQPRDVDGSVLDASGSVFGPQVDASVDGAASEAGMEASGDGTRADAGVGDAGAGRDAGSPDAGAGGTLDAGPTLGDPGDAAADGSVADAGGGPTDAGSGQDAGTDGGGTADAGDAAAGTTGLTCFGDPLPTMTAGILIDDFEDGDRFVDTSAGLGGFWYTTTDETDGEIEPEQGDDATPSGAGAGGSAYAMRVTVSEAFDSWGATLSVYPIAEDCAVNAAGVTGLRFSLRGSGNLDVRFATGQTAPPQWGGNCGVQDPLDECNDHFEASVTATPTWTTHEIAWSELEQGGFGTRFPALAADELIYFEFLVHDGELADFQIDDVMFY